MTANAGPESFAFETEVNQLLHLMIHSLYSDKEIFVRELVSNAADACDKLRFAALTDTAAMQNGAHEAPHPLAEQLGIVIEIDEDAKTVCIEDNGIGMTREEIIANLGTIARSGTRQFMDAIAKNDDGEKPNLIGQFGVGFYSAFMVAERVHVETKSAVEPDQAATSWTSDGSGEYQLDASDKQTRGTRITLKLRDDAHEFAEHFRIRNVINKYSDHIALPIYLDKKIEKTSAENEDVADDKQEDEAQAPWEKINEGAALWAKPRNELSEDDYNGFYKSLTYDQSDPLITLHNRVEGNVEYTSLLFVPSRAPFDLWDRDRQHGVKLFVRRVFITDDTETLMPAYLRFVRGVVDAADLPLNISREFLQKNKDIERIRSATVKKILAELKRLADNKPDDFATFWKEFGRAFKEGIIEDHANRETIASLLRFSTTTSDDADVSLDTYIERKAIKQDAIYYLTAESVDAAKASPHLEIFKKNNIEVLLLGDPVDEWVVGHLNEYKEVPLKSVAKGQLDESLQSDATELNKHQESMQPIIEKFKKVLENDVKDVRLTNRLTDSPACLVADEHDLGGNMARILKATGQDAPVAKPILEINPEHPLVKGLKPEGADVESWMRVLFDQAALSEGATLEKPADYVQRVNSLLTKLAMSA